MANLVDLLEGHADQNPNVLEVLRLGAETAMLLLFTPDVEEVPLHWESDEEVHSYVVCPGTGCPVCYLGAPPQTMLLLPVYSMEHREVLVLRIPSKRGPQALCMMLLPHLKDEAIFGKVLLLKREGAKYSVEARELPENADRGESSIQSFMQRQEKGLQLQSAFMSMTSEELASVERIRRKLDAMGGYSPDAK